MKARLTTTGVGFGRRKSGRLSAMPGLRHLVNGAPVIVGGPEPGGLTSPQEGGVMTRNWATLSVADLEGIASEKAVLTDQELQQLRAEHHNEGMLRSHLNQKLQNVLWTMFNAGELTLNTRRPCNDPDLIEADWR